MIAMNSRWHYGFQIHVIYGKRTDWHDIDLELLAPGTGFRLEKCGKIPLHRSLAAAGDVNADGIGDLLVGVHINPGRGTENRLVRSRVAYVIYGKAAAPAGINLATLNSSQGFEMEGRTRHGYNDNWTSRLMGAKAGELNGDGVDDFVVLDDWTQFYVVYGTAGSWQSRFAPAASDKPEPGARIPDRIVLPDLRLPEHGFKIRTPYSYHNQVTGIGDVDGDALDDLLIGGPAGSAFIIYGQRDRAYGFLHAHLPATVQDEPSGHGSIIQGGRQ